MTTYFVLSAFPSRPISLIANNKVPTVLLHGTDAFTRNISGLHIREYEVKGTHSRHNNVLLAQWSTNFTDNLNTQVGGTQRRSWARHCATSRKGAGSIPDSVTGIFHWHNPSGRTMAPGVDSASNRYEYQEYFLGGKGGRCVGLTTLPPSCADCFEIWEPQPSGTLRACPGL